MFHFAYHFIIFMQIEEIGISCHFFCQFQQSLNNMLYFLIHTSFHLSLISLHIRSMWETTVMHKQVSGWTVNFGPNSPVYPLLRNTPPPHYGKLQIWDDQSLLRTTPPIMENFRFGMTKVYSEIPPHPSHYGKLQIWDDQSLLQNTPPPHYGKLQIWDDQSLLRNTPPTPTPLWKTSDLGWPKFTPKYPPPLLWNTSDLGWPKFTPEYPPPNQPKIVREFKSKIFRIPRVTTCGDFIQPG